MRQALLVLALMLMSSVASAGDVPQSFTLDGRLFSNPEGTTPLTDASLGMRIQILDEDKTCVLYEEKQTLSTLASQGYFTVQVGSLPGSTKRTVLGDSGRTMSEVFSNLMPISGKAVVDGIPCVVPAVAAKRRYVRLIISPSYMGGVERTLSPDLTIDSVPNAVVAERAESLQGVRSDQLLKVNQAGGNVLTQQNLESLFTSTARFNAVTALADGTSAMYMRSNSTTGAQLPRITGAPATTPPQGAIWFDQADERIKFQTNGGPVTLTTGGSAISALTGDVSASGNGTVTATVNSVGGSTAANVHTATELANNSTDLNTASTIVRRNAGGSFAASFVLLNESRLKDSGANYVSLRSPATVTSYAITFPAAVGGVGQTLVTSDSAGTMTWVTPLSAPASTPGRVPKFATASTLADSLISDDGNQIVVAGNVVSTPNVATGDTVDLRTSNTHVLSSIGGDTIRLQYPTHGGLYNIVVADTAPRTYTFDGCTTSYYKPARGPTTVDTHTVYGVLFVSAGGGNWNCYITWSTGFAQVP